MLRAPDTMVESLLRMKWFSDESLNNISWLHQSKKAPYIPFFVPKEDIQNWEKSNELERCCYYYNLMYKNIRDEEATIIDYDEFVKNPSVKFNKLTKHLGLKNGEMTNSLLENIYTDRISKKHSNNLIPKDTYENMMNVYHSVLERDIEFNI